MANGVITTKKGGNKISFRPQEIIFARYELTSHEQDILDEVISKIGEEDDTEDNCTYEIIIGEMQDKYGNKWSKDKYSQLRDAVNMLWDREFDILQDNGKIKTYRWLSAKEYQSALCTNKDDDKPDVSKIKVDIHPEVKKMILSAKQGTFFSNKISMRIRGKYARKLYYQLLNKESLHREWIVPIDELRKLLSIPKSYNAGMIKARVLDEAQKEFEEVADITFTYKSVEEKTVKKGRNGIGAFAFAIKKKNGKGKKNVIIDMESKDEMQLAQETAQLLGCTLIEANNLVSLAKQNGYIGDGDVVKYKEILTYTLEREPESPVNYAYAIIKNGFNQTSQKQKVANDFNNFKNSAYKDMDFEEFEQQILSN